MVPQSGAKMHHKMIIGAVVTVLVMRGMVRGGLGVAAQNAFASIFAGVTPAAGQ